MADGYQWLAGEALRFASQALSISMKVNSGRAAQKASAALITIKNIDKQVLFAYIIVCNHEGG